MENKRVIELHTKVTGKEELKRLNGAYEQIGKSAKAANDSLHNSSKQMQKSTRGIANMGHVATNVGYQVQDLAVQIQGGVNPMKAMSQQIPQMLIGFGAFGAAIGVVIALLPTLVTLMGVAGDEVEDFGSSLDEANDAISSIGSQMDTINFGAWNAAWNESNKAVRANMLSMLELQHALAALELSEAVKALSTEVEEGMGKLTIFQQVWRGIMDATTGQDTSIRKTALELENMADALDIDPSQAAVVRDLLQDLKDETKTAAEVGEAFAAMGLGAESGSKAFLEFAVRTKELAQAQANLVKTQEQLAAARTGENLPEDTSSKKPVDTLDAARKAVRQFAHVYKDAADLIKLGAEAINAEEAETNRLWADQNPRLAAYAEAVDVLQEKKARLIITDEQYNEALARQQRILAEGFDSVKAYSDVFTGAMDGFANDVIRDTEDIGGAFEDMAKKIIAEMAKIAAIKGIASLFAGAGYTGISDALIGSVNADGNAFSGGKVVPFANGGVVSSPTMFPMANGAGLMGEAGPEAIVPLNRGPGGKLGVGASPVNLTVNNMASGVEVKARQTDSGITLDVVMAQVAGAVRQGGNDLSNALESSYSLGRGGAAY